MGTQPAGRCPYCGHDCGGVDLDLDDLLPYSDAVIAALEREDVEADKGTEA